MTDYQHAMVHNTPETILIHKEERMERKPRYTCRDEDGNARLLDGENLMDAIERLAVLEEDAMGRVVQGHRVECDPWKRRRGNG